MKFLHLGDLHLGKSLNEFDLEADQEFILNQIVEIVKKEEIDGVLIAGDVYDRAIPSESATNLLDTFLSNLKNIGIDVFMISGNHDSDDRLNYGSKIFADNNIYISSVFNGSLYKQTVTDEYGDVNVYLLPFVKASQVRHFYPDETIESYEDAVRVIIKNANIDTKKRNVIVAHQFVIGKESDPELGGSESPAVASVGLVEKISFSCFDDFDYAALGHIHSAQKIGRETVRYSGSPLKYSLSEVNHKKSVPVIELSDKGDVKVTLVELKPLRDLRHLKGKLKDIANSKNVEDPNDFIYVTLTDEEVVSDAITIIQQFYKNTLKVNYENSHTLESDNDDFISVTENKSYEELVREFYSMMFGRDITDEEMEVMMDAGREAGVVDEAN